MGLNIDTMYLTVDDLVRVLHNPNNNQPAWQPAFISTTSKHSGKSANVLGAHGESGSLCSNFQPNSQVVQVLWPPCGLVTGWVIERFTKKVTHKKTGDGEMGEKWRASWRKVGKMGISALLGLSYVQSNENSKNGKSAFHVYHAQLLNFHRNAMTAPRKSYTRQKISTTGVKCTLAGKNSMGG